MGKLGKEEEVIDYHKFCYTDKCGRYLIGDIAVDIAVNETDRIKRHIIK